MFQLSGFSPLLFPLLSPRVLGKTAFRGFPRGETPGDPLFAFPPRWKTGGNPGSAENQLPRVSPRWKTPGKCSDFLPGFPPGAFLGIPPVVYNSPPVFPPVFPPGSCPGGHFTSPPVSPGGKPRGEKYKFPPGFPPGEIFSRFFPWVFPRGNTWFSPGFPLIFRV